MDRAWWMRIMALAAAGYPSSVFGASPHGPVSVVTSVIGLGAFCLLGSLLCVFLAWALGWRWQDTCRKTRIGSPADRSGQDSSETDDPWGPRPR